MCKSMTLKVSSDFQIFVQIFDVIIDTRFLSLTLLRHRMCLRKSAFKAKQTIFMLRNLCTIIQNIRSSPIPTISYRVRGNMDPMFCHITECSVLTDHFWEHLKQQKKYRHNHDHAILALKNFVF